MNGAAKPPEGWVWKTVLTVIILTIFLVGSLIYVGFYAIDYSLFQKIVVVIVSLIISFAIIAVLWIIWYRKQGSVKE